MARPPVTSKRPPVQLIRTREDLRDAYHAVSRRFSLSSDCTRLVRITKAGRTAGAQLGRTVSASYCVPLAPSTRYICIHPVRYRTGDVIRMLRSGPDAPVPFPNLSPVTADWTDARPENWRASARGFSTSASERLEAAGAASGLFYPPPAPKPGRDGKPVAIRGRRGLIEDPVERLCRPVSHWIAIAAEAAKRWPGILATPWHKARAEWPALWALAHHLAREGRARADRVFAKYPGTSIRDRGSRALAIAAEHRMVDSMRRALMARMHVHLPYSTKVPPSALDTTPTLAPILAWALAEHAAGRLHDTAEQAAAAWLPARADAAAAPMPTPAQTAPAEPEDDDLF